MSQERNELLVLAARAASIYLNWDEPGDPVARDGDEWNPLEDDGDAFRLALTLGIQVWRDGDILWIDHAPIEHKDIEAEARWAIVRAAAEIGLAMK